MGKIIPLPKIAAAYPDTSTALDPAECILLIAVRWRVHVYRQDEDPLPRLCQGFHITGAEDAAFSVDGLMRIIARTVGQPMIVHRPRCPRLSSDEKHVLHAAAIAQAGNLYLAEKALHCALLTAEGAEFALGPLQGLAILLAEAGMFFRKRKPPGGKPILAGSVEP